MYTTSAAVAVNINALLCAMNITRLLLVTSGSLIAHILLHVLSQLEKLNSLTCPLRPAVYKLVSFRCIYVLFPWQHYRYPCNAAMEAAGVSLSPCGPQGTSVSFTLCPLAGTNLKLDILSGQSSSHNFHTIGVQKLNEVGFNLDYSLKVSAFKQSS